MGISWHHLDLLRQLTTALILIRDSVEQAGAGWKDCRPSRLRALERREGVAPENPSLIEREPGGDWRDLQARVAAILRECGMAAEAGRTMPVARGIVEIDVYAEDPATTPRGVYLCECKRWRSRVPQAEVQNFRTIVADAGAHFGLFISAQGFQEGAQAVVKYTNVHLLDWPAFQALFAGRWCQRHFAPVVRDVCSSLASYAEMPGNDAVLRLGAGEPINQGEAVGLMVNSYWSPPFMDFGPKEADEPIVDEIWKERDAYLDYLPPGVATASALRELLDALVVFAREWTGSRRC